MTVGPDLTFNGGFVDAFVAKVGEEPPVEVTVTASYSAAAENVADPGVFTMTISSTDPRKPAAEVDLTGTAR